MSIPGTSTRPKQAGKQGRSLSCSSSSDDDDESSSSVSSSSTSDYLPTPPDGEWGWLVVFASFMVHMIADGVSFSFGVFYVELLDYFQESKAKTAWVGALFVSVPLVAGPIASALTNKYGCRMVTIMGSIVATMGFLLSIAAPSLEILCITFGLISGLGLAMVYVPAVVIVAFYFEKRRAFATGLAVCGSGIGTFIFAPLTEYLIDEYGWRGTLLIQAGLLLNMCVCGACFRPLETSVQRKKRKFLRSLDKFSKNNSIAHSEQSLEEKSKCGHIQSTLSDISDFDETKLRLLIEPASQSLITIPTYLNAVDSTVYLSKYNQVNACHDLKKSQEGQNKEKEASTTEDGESTAPVKGSHPANISESHEDTLLKLNDLKEIVWHKQKVVNIKHRGRTSSQVSHPFLRKDIFYRGSLIKIAPCTIATCSKASSCPVLSQYQHEDAIAASVDGAPCQTLKFSKKVKGVMKEMLDVSILKNPKFVIFCVSNLILYMWYDVPYMFSTDRAIYLGISEALASFLVSILGIINTIGQVLYGYIGDIPSINPTLLYLVSITIAGVATMAMPLCTTYASMCIYATVFGFAISANFSLTTIILVDLIGMDRLTNAFGLVMLGQGVSNVIGPPIAGWLSDVTGQYDAAFLVAGVWIAFSGLILMGIFLINCYDRRRHKADKSSHTSLQFQPKRASLRHIWKEDEHWIRQQPSSFPDIKVACTETVV